MYFLLLVAGLLAGASAKNLKLGAEGGHLIYEQNKTASPAIWKQQEQVTVNVTDSDIISQINVIDCREDQNGEASVLEGGVGSKNVTILLKSPSILRGYCFEVYVYAMPDEGQVHVVDNNQQSVDEGQVHVVDNNQQSVDEGQVHVIDNNQQSVDGQQTVQHRIPELSSTQQPSTSTQVPDGQKEIQHPVQVSHDQEQSRQSRHTEVQKETPLTPVVGKDETDKKNPLDVVDKDMVSQIFDEEIEYPQQASREPKTTVVPVANEKTTEVHGQQTKLPLPYVTEKSLQTEKPDTQEEQKVKTI